MPNNKEPDWLGVQPLVEHNARLPSISIGLLGCTASTQLAYQKHNGPLETALCAGKTVFAPSDGSPKWVFLSKVLNTGPNNKPPDAYCMGAQGACMLILDSSISQ